MSDTERDEAAPLSAEDAGAASEDAPKQPRKKNKNKKWMVLGIVVVAVAALGFGFNAWHSTPGFCSAICHTPMDAYTKTFIDGNVDKYGNELTSDEAVGMMAYSHGKSGAANCLSCHVPTLGEQMSEGAAWIAGDYEVAGVNKQGDSILETRTYDQLVAARGLDSGDQFCLNSTCHANADGTPMTRDDLVKATASLADERNPHAQPHGATKCGDCHKGHEQSVNTCSKCHTDAPIPQGWLTYSQAQEKEQLA
jgi:hypothetical protein